MGFFGAFHRSELVSLTWEQIQFMSDGMIIYRVRRPIKQGKVRPVLFRLVMSRAVRYAHSLRRGFSTESARLGASMPAIQRHGRWRSTKTVVEYIEAGRQFTDSAVNVLFEF